jgi:fibro-slime domain-containing protein
MRIALTKVVLGAAAVLAAAGLGTSAYAAGSVTATFNTLTSSNPDVEGPVTGVVLGEVQNTLGPNGLPVESFAGEFSDVNPVTGEILWWRPNGSWVTAGTSNWADGTYSLPFSVPSNFFANGSSDGGANGYISTELQATFNAPDGGSVTFTLGSDDDAFVFLNGKLVVDDGGVHAIATAPTTVSGLLDGVNTVDVFQVDRHTVQSALVFDANVTLNAVPEPSTWAMMGLGFAALGFAGFRRASLSRKHFGRTV